MPDLDQRAIELQAHIQGGRRPDAVYGPGWYFYWFLAHHLAAEAIESADICPDVDQTNASERSGSVFLVTQSAFVLADYEAAADEKDGDPNQEFGTASTTFYSRAHCPVESLRWDNRSLRIPVDHFRGQPVPVKLQPHSISLVGRGWNVDLPGEPIDDADAYFGALRRAVEL